MIVARRPAAPAAVLLAAAVAACGTPASVATRTPPDGAMGVLVMAHGGGDEWNAAVEDAVAPLRDAYPIEIAFGMADRPALQDAVTRLEARGVERIAVVRLFISGASFLHQTEYLLGVRADPPDTFTRHGTGAADGAHAPPPPVERRARVAVSHAGLVESDLAGEILAARVQALSRDPARESVLLLAHGMGADDHNAELLHHLDRLADHVRGAGGFRDVRVETLREDWQAKREGAEQRIRDYVTAAAEDGGAAIVVPVRVHGFGPYASVLDGLTYRHGGLGLVPHPLVTTWIRQQAEGLAGAAYR